MKSITRITTASVATLLIGNCAVASITFSAGSGADAASATFAISGGDLQITIQNHCHPVLANVAGCKLFK